MIKLLGVLNPYKYVISGSLFALVVGTVMYLNWRVDALKENNAVLENTNKNLQAVNESWGRKLETLTGYYKDQAKAVEDMATADAARQKTLLAALQKIKPIQAYRGIQFNAAEALKLNAGGKNCDDFVRDAKNILKGQP